MKVGVIGADGYVGIELNRLLAGHPEVSEVINYSPVEGLDTFSSVHPGIWRNSNIFDKTCHAEEIADKCRVFFTALPSGLSLKYAERAIAAGNIMIDMGADFRFDDFNTYEKTYGCYKENPFLQNAVYGLPEINRDKIKKGKIIGNPGCFPTSIILGITPLLREGLIKDKKIIVDAKSGASGAGKKKEVDFLFCEVNENITAYKPFTHRHVPEIEQEINKFSSKQLKVLFNPHLIPVNRGIMSSIYLGVDEKCTKSLIENAYDKYYGNEIFIRITEYGQLPQIKWVQGSNLCMIGFFLDKETSTLLVVSTIDNLIKGAAGQAIQNMNIVMGYPETAGIESSGFYF